MRGQQRRAWALLVPWCAPSRVGGAGAQCLGKVQDGDGGSFCESPYEWLGDEQEFWGEIQHQTRSLSHCSFITISITRVMAAPGVQGQLWWLLGSSPMPTSIPAAAVGTWNQPNSPRARKYLGILGCSPVSCCWFQSSWHKTVYSNSSSKRCPRIFPHAVWLGEAVPSTPAWSTQKFFGSAGRM